MLEVLRRSHPHVANDQRGLAVDVLGLIIGVVVLAASQG
jgi:hypothetical protein